jgi:lipopolysaccharide/colanic/teichoic acid biosynthesis glycosyltransferase
MPVRVGTPDAEEQLPPVTSIRYQTVRPQYRPPASRAAAHSSDRPATTGARARRGLNVSAAAVGIVLAAPVMLLIALVIRFTSKGPILYQQRRVGIDRRRSSARLDSCRRRDDGGGRPFTIYKFRTMYVQDESRTAQVWASQDDPRITPVGRILRKYRLDELPQLFNVLQGDMNIVGPRPEQPDIFAQLRQEVSRYNERQQVLPGITGWAQVRHHYDTSVDDVRRKVEFDLEYINRCSAAEDAKIMLMTVPVMMFKQGSL